MKRLVTILLLVIFFAWIGVKALSGRVLEGKITDINTREPVVGAKVTLVGSPWVAFSDISGQFSLFTGTDNVEFEKGFKYKVIGNNLYWQSQNSLELRLINMLGQELLRSTSGQAASGKIPFSQLPVGIYLFTVQTDSQKAVARLYLSKDDLTLSKFKSLKCKDSDNFSGEVTDSILVTASGYYDQKFPYIRDGSNYQLLKITYDDIDYLNHLSRPEAFKMLKSVPFVPAFGEVESVKLVYSIPDKQIYYTNSEKFLIHYYFARDVLGYSKGHYLFNVEQYTQNDNRIYFLASLNRFKSSGIYTLDFFTGDEIDCAGIQELYTKIVQTSYIGDSLKFFAGVQKWENCTSVPSITADELYAGQNFQALNPAENYGYLKRIGLNELGSVYLGRHDVVLTNGIPNDLPVTAGIITTEFQTPLSHINVLSHNRGTPNMALRDGWTNSHFSSLENKLVYLKVTLDSFYLREAEISEAQAFWATREPSQEIRLNIDSTSSGIINLNNAGVNSVRTIGGKAANFAELLKVRFQGIPLPLPEESFAIPFFITGNT